MSRATSDPATAWGRFWSSPVSEPPRTPSERDIAAQARAQLRHDQLSNARAIRARHNLRGIRP